MSIKQIIVVRKDLNMRKGKLAAQVAHASMKFILANDRSLDHGHILTYVNEDKQDWMSSGMTKIVVGVDSKEELENLIQKAQESEIEVYSITDSGKTEFKGVPTLTCAAFGPAKSEKLDLLTGKLKLL